MATEDNKVRRISDKTEITMGTADTNLSGTDKFMLQHTSGDNKDYSLPLNYIQAIPVGSTSTASGTATKVVSLSNYPSDYTPVVGSKILVKFTNANTATTQVYLTIGSVTAPATVKGFALKSGIPAGSQIEFTYTGDAFNCQDFAISTIDTTSLQPVNSSAVNGALANYQKSITIPNPWGSTRYITMSVPKGIGQITIISNYSQKIVTIVNSEVNELVLKTYGNTDVNWGTSGYVYDSDNKKLYIQFQNYSPLIITNMSEIEFVGISTTNPTTQDYTHGNYKFIGFTS